MTAIDGAELPTSLVDSFKASRYRWRTAEGVARDAGVSVGQAVSLLESSPQIVRAAKPNQRGMALYTLRPDYKRSETLVGRIVAALANAPE